MKDIQMNMAFKALTSQMEINSPLAGKPITGEIEGIEKTSGVNAGKDFSNILDESINKVNNLQQEADGAINRLALGEPQELHDTIIAIQKANTSFRLMMEVRNKLIDAYKEVINMRV